MARGQIYRNVPCPWYFCSFHSAVAACQTSLLLSFSFYYANDSLDLKQYQIPNHKNQITYDALNKNAYDSRVNQSVNNHLSEP